MVQVGLYPHKCRQCGKQFEGRSEYAYKIQKENRTENYYYFCSYSHLRQYEKEHPPKIRITQRQQDIIRLVNKGMNTNEIAESLGLSRSRVVAVREKAEDLKFMEVKKNA